MSEKDEPGYEEWAASIEKMMEILSDVKTDNMDSEKQVLLFYLKRMSIN